MQTFIKPFYLSEGQDVVFTQPGGAYYLDLVDAHGDSVVNRIARTDEPATVENARLVLEAMNRFSDVSIVAGEAPRSHVAA